MTRINLSLAERRTSDFPREVGSRYRRRARPGCLGPARWERN
jgi:hypothetical protein